MVQELSAALSRTVALCAAVLPVMLLGCLAGSVLTSSRAGQRCGALCSPVARLAGLDRYGSTYLVLCFLNFNAANAYLASLIRAGRVRKSGLLGVYLAGWLPASCHYYVFYFAPILLPALGVGTAGLVLALYVVASLAIFAAGAALNRAQGSMGSGSDNSAGPQAVDWPAWPGWRSVLRQGGRQFAGIAAVFASCILVVELVIASPPARALLDMIQPAIAWTGAPPASALVVAAALPSAMGGFAVAIACLGDSLLSLAQLPVVLMAAALGHAIFSAFTHFLPANVAIFGPTAGARLTFTSLCVRLPCLILALVAAWLLTAMPAISG